MAIYCFLTFAFVFSGFYYFWRIDNSIVMQVFKFVTGTIVLMAAGFCAIAQGPGLDREHWVKANLYYKQDAIDFITTAYKDFTPVIGGKHTMETGIYRRSVKLKGCELVIETESRTQESYYKNDREFEKDIVVIELDKVMLDGDDIKPSSPENANGLFGGSSFEHSHKIPSYSILTPVINKDDSKFIKLHYEEHLQWAYQFLIDKCKEQ